jgi:hypothetical protein
MQIPRSIKAPVKQGNAMQITRRNILTAGVGALTVAAALKAFAAWQPNDRYPDPAIYVSALTLTSMFQWKIFEQHCKHADFH